MYVHDEFFVVSENYILLCYVILYHYIASKHVTMQIWENISRAHPKHSNTVYPSIFTIDFVDLQS